MPIESYTIVDGQRIADPTGDVSPGTGGQPDAAGASGTDAPAATGGEASSAAPERSAPQTQETSPAGEAGDAAALDDDLSDVDDDVATIPYVNRRIKQLNAKRRATERQLAAERQQHALEIAQLRGHQEAVQRLLSGAAPALPETPAPPAGPPQAEQFASHEDYVLAAARYGAQQEFAARDQQTAQERQQAAQLQFQRELMSREAQFKQAHPDFDSVVRGGLAGKVSPVLQQALMLVPDGPAVAYTLAQQPELVQRLNALPPPLVLVELGRLSGPGSAMVDTSRDSARAGAPGSTNGTTAPTLHAPETPLSGAGGGAPTGGYSDSMSMDEYKAWRKRTSTLPAWKER